MEKLILESVRRGETFEEFVKKHPKEVRRFKFKPNN